MPEKIRQRGAKVGSIVAAREGGIREVAVRLRKAAVRDMERLRSEGWTKEDFIGTLGETLGSNEVESR